MTEGKNLDQRYLELLKENKTNWQRLRTRPKIASEDTNEEE